MFTLNKRSGWHTSAVKILAAVCVCTLTSILPAWSQTTIEPHARQIFTKAAKKYGAARTLHLKWRDNATEQFENGGDLMGFARGSVAFDRRGLLRWHSTAPSTRYSLVVVDGKATSLLLSERVNLETHPVYERKPLDGGGRQSAFEQLKARGEWFPTLAAWLQGRSPLSRGAVSQLTREAQIARYSAKVLATAKFNKQPCDLVRINITYRNKKILQETYWFHQSGGQLLRVQHKKSVGSSDDNDIRIESQQFNLKLAPATFRFVPPKRATLVKSG